MGFKGKVIYNPSGKASEYSYWAANFYNGCSGDCSYCYMKKGVMSVNWSIKPTLKKCFNDGVDAYKSAVKEIDKNHFELQKNGLFLNFNSDPFLKETFNLNRKTLSYCNFRGIPTKILTKQSWWVDKIVLHLSTSIGFTLTGYDELEPGCSTNLERIKAMKYLSNMGFKVWASIEPVIDVFSSFRMIEKSLIFCDHFKIGLLSGKKFDKSELQTFISGVNMLANALNEKTTIYWKDDILKQADLKREDLSNNCVDRNYNF
jgi:DNA repair photolyase